MPNGAQFKMITKKVEVTGLLYSEKNFNAIGNILIQDISFIGKVEPATSATGDEKNGQSSKLGRNKSILKISI